MAAAGRAGAGTVLHAARPPLLPPCTQGHVAVCSPGQPLTHPSATPILQDVLPVHAGGRKLAGSTDSGGGTAAARLVDGPSNAMGRLEVLVGGRWGTVRMRWAGAFAATISPAALQSVHLPPPQVCDDFFDDDDAGVVCRQLGLGTAGVAQSMAPYGPGSLPILMGACCREAAPGMSQLCSAATPHPPHPPSAQTT